MWLVKQKILTGSSVNWIAKDGSILFHFNTRPDANIIYLNCCPIKTGWENDKCLTIDYDGTSFVEA